MDAHPSHRLNMPQPAGAHAGRRRRGGRVLGHAVTREADADILNAAPGLGAGDPRARLRTGFREGRT
ncbi:hypothetical protein PsYK624_125670 [Phanerochaete sordida]|uniref:Uncharacterized protein n=1 Tax=Phanerochaete sordida TaxID=48140 RepID=A0A9P3LJM6_9APHY|nr:hypothetical protein PsYK624_125670 [Phanerochaete sordida]